MKNIIVTCFFVLMQLGILVHAQTNTTTDIYLKSQDGYACFRIPAIVKSKAGTLLAFAEARKNSCSDTGNIDLVVKRSEDGGKTWSRIITVSYRRPRNRSYHLGQLLEFRRGSRKTNHR